MKVAFAAPVAAAVTVYAPGVPFAVAITLAVVPLIVAVPADSVAAAPFTGVTVKVTTPPATGSPVFFAVTVTVRSWGKGVPTRVDCVPPLLIFSMKPWLSKAPMSGALTRGLPR